MGGASGGGGVWDDSAAEEIGAGSVLDEVSGMAGRVGAAEERSTSLSGVEEAAVVVAGGCTPLASSCATCND